MRLVEETNRVKADTVHEMVIRKAAMARSCGNARGHQAADAVQQLCGCKADAQLDDMLCWLEETTQVLDCSQDGGLRLVRRPA